MKDPEQEARETLERVERDSETLGSSSLNRMSRRMTDHFSGRDAIGAGGRRRNRPASKCGAEESAEASRLSDSSCWSIGWHPSSGWFDRGEIMSRTCEVASALAGGFRGAGRRGLSQACRRRSAALCDGVVIRVEDFPDDETLTEMDCETPFDLLGLFRGVGLAQGGAHDADRPVPQHGLALSPPAARLLGRARGNVSATSSPMCWCTRSATISASPTTTWRPSKRRPDKACSGTCARRQDFVDHGGLTREADGRRGPDDEGLRRKARSRRAAGRLRRRTFRPRAPPSAGTERARALRENAHGGDAPEQLAGRHGLAECRGADDPEDRSDAEQEEAESREQRRRVPDRQRDARPIPGGRTGGRCRRPARRCSRLRMRRREKRPQHHAGAVDGEDQADLGRDRGRDGGPRRERRPRRARRTLR